MEQSGHFQAGTTELRASDNLDSIPSFKIPALQLHIHSGCQHGIIERPNYVGPNNPLRHLRFGTYRKWPSTGNCFMRFSFDLVRSRKINRKYS